MTEPYWPKHSANGMARGEDGHTEAESKVLRLLSSCPRALTSLEIHSFIGGNADTVRHQLRRMVGRGLLERRGGYYGLTGRE